MRKASLWARVALVAVAWAMAAGEASAAAKAKALDVGAFYVKQATWYETMFASREALMRAEAREAQGEGPAPLDPALRAFQPVRVIIEKGGKGRRVKVPVAGLKTLYLGAFCPGGMETRINNPVLIHNQGMPVPLELKPPMVGKMTGKRSATPGDAKKGAPWYRLDDTELALALGGEYKRLDVTFNINKGRAGDTAVFWATAQPALAGQQKAIADRGAIWAAVARDFATHSDRLEQVRERDFWSADWQVGDLKAIAQRYASACRQAAKSEASKAASSAATLGDLQKVRQLFYLGERYEQAKGLLDDVNPPAMRRAIADLMSTFGDRYPKGAEFLKRLDAVEKDLPAIRQELSAGGEQALKKAEAVLAFQREALLSNPLLDFDKLLLVRRAVDNLGLVNNWLSNSSAPKNGYDNEIAVLSPLRPDGPIATLYRPEGGRFVGDVDLNFDADRMIFSMPGETNWQVWEINVDGGGLRQITPDVKEVDSYDACYLPDGRIIFTSTANMQGVPCIGGGGHVANLAQVDPATGKIRMLAFEQDHDWCPTVRADGTVMYLRWEYTDTPHYYTRLIASMNPDGTNQKALYGSNSYWPNSTFFARPVPGHPTQFVGVISGHHDTKRMGELILFDTAQGQFEADGVLQRIPGYGKKVQPVVKDGLVGGSWPHFLHPWPLSDKYFLVSRKIERRGDSAWGIYLVDVFDNMLLIRGEPGYALLEPIPLRQTARPPAIPDRVDLTRNDALVYMVDVYAGPGLAGVPRGRVKRLRVFTYTFGYRGMGGHNCFGVESGWDAKRIIGTVPVEADGSALFRVPANTPLSIQPLDANGSALQLMRSWMTAMPGEFLSCVGCHENEHDVTPVRQTLASRRRPRDIEPWYGPTRGLGFIREVQPALDRYCVGCHDGKKQGMPNFADTTPGYRGYSGSYHALHRYVRRPGPESDYHMLDPMEYHSSTSELVQILNKGHHNVRLDGEAWDRLMTWIDMNVPYHPTWTAYRGGKMGTVAERYRELQKIYANLDVDPEAIPPTPETKIEPIIPPQPPKAEVAIPSAEAWPFGAVEAGKRQAALGQTALAFKLGTTPPKRDRVTCKEIPPVEVEMKLVRVPAGQFVMGGAAGDDDERPLAAVEVRRPFWIGAVEVTNAQYSLFDPTHDSRCIDMELKDQELPGYPADGYDQPVIRVSWREAMAFCKWLAAKTGRQVTLPTEAQWEWACRAGTDTPLWYGQGDADFGALANLSDVNVKKFALEKFRPRIAENPSPYHAYIPKVETVDDKHQISAPVGQYKPNAWGLCDMHGNVAEWTRSLYRPYPYADADGRNDPAAAGKRVVRGGSWYDRPKRARSAFRLPYEAHQKVFNVGFRVVIED